MIRVVPYMYTSGSEKFKQFLALPFTFDMLYPIKGDKSSELLFDTWKCKEMINWQRFTNEDKIILEVYPTYYTISKNTPNAIKYMLSLPKTINEFINDMDRFGIQLYWTTWIDQNFEPKEYLAVDEIKQYYIDLLGKMGKSHELL
jgi:hypothetical protein